ncbi:hypothetical protein AAG570_010363 [Ranatra chinensis]|uniref:Uncharacterized protein n=1 Tax=Ranatra chinensis TaxID=642074 RepID=A0ABD0YMB9_9HEMI
MHTLYTHLKIYMSLFFCVFRSDFSDNENINLEVDFYIPKVLIKGNYKVDGIIAEFAVNGKGPYNISMTDVQGTLKINGHVIKEDEVEYFRVHKVSMQPDVGNMSIYFANLVNGNPELSAIAVTFFNQFWRVIYPEILPYADETFDKVLRNLINQATLKIPYNQLIPE